MRTLLPDRRLDACQVAANVRDQDVFDDILRSDIRVEEGEVAGAIQCFIAQPADNGTRLRTATLSRVEDRLLAHCGVFGGVLGIAVVKYLQWQWQELKNEVRIETVATLLGYESEVALRKAFKREMGMPPAQYRRLG